MKTFILSFFLCLASITVYAQLSNNDCVKSKTVCGNSDLGVSNVGGSGINDFANPNNLDGCLNGEHQSAWYSFTVKTSGTLIFTITPNAPTDYDFAVYGPNKTCNALSSPIRCNFVGTNGVTGLSLTITTNIGALSPALQVFAGDTYYLLLDNFILNNNIGFSMSWGGTAVLEDPSGEGSVGNTQGFSVNVGCLVAQFNTLYSKCGAIVESTWDFGDGSPVVVGNSAPAHAYTGLGTYTVTLSTKIVASSVPEDLNQIKTFTQFVSISQASPNIQITNLQNRYCTGDASFPLTATVMGAGGIFTIQKNQTGAYVTASAFDPAGLGVGKHNVRYVYNNLVQPSCSGTDNRVVDVFATPIVTTNTLKDDYCVTSAPFTLVGQPAGGTFTINNQTRTIFNPMEWGVGTAKIVYSYTSPTNSCVGTSTRYIAIHSPSEIVINFAPFPTRICASGNAFTLSATPENGTMKINGTPNTVFNPAMLGAGLHTVTYSYTSSTECSNSRSVQVEVLPAPVLSVTGWKPKHCISEGLVTLQALPTGGTLRIDGQVASSFLPATLGLGNHTIRYEYTDATDATCFNTLVENFTIYALPVPSWEDVSNTYCALDNIQVTPKVVATLASGNQITEVLPALAFNPSQLPIGNHTLTHTVLDTETGCSKETSKTVVILPSPFPTFTDLKNAYCQEAYAIKLQASPSNGTFTVNGLPADSLKPRSFAVGEKVQVHYAVTNAQGCSNSITQEVEILPNVYEIAQSQYRGCPNPRTPFYIEAMPADLENDFLASGVVPYYFWDRSTENVRVLPLTESRQGGKHEVFVRDVEGCILYHKTIEMQVDCEAKLFVPTAFTPNGDALNPKWQLFGEFVTKLDFKVYNRLGEIIFVTHNPHDAWDGTVAGKEAPAGVYVWQARYENILRKGEVIKQQGQVLLIR